ncbi:hypothetical protein GQ54DRAFT_308050 [Martensiomyces pterosporus]|nr:hypothetical protein GQ54DRAFT_308050 [Martensiomyces pterosporus]
MYLEQQHPHHSLRTQPAHIQNPYSKNPQPTATYRHYAQQPQQPPALVLPSPTYTGDRSKQYYYQGQQPISQPHSPNSCYSPGASMSSDATVVDYPASTLPKDGPSAASVRGAAAKSPALSYASSKTASPVPLAALAAVATAEHSQVHGGHTARVSPATPPRMVGDAEEDSQPQQPARRRRGGRGSRSIYTAEEKEMRRKISHSAIEKRRRERTNNVLRDLQNMVPWLSKSNKVQKLEILEAAAQYIKELRSPHSSGSASPSAAFKNSPTSSVATRVEEEEDDEDDCSLSIPNSPSQRAMKVNFLLS